MCNIQHLSRSPDPFLPHGGHMHHLSIVGHPDKDDPLQNPRCQSIMESLRFCFLIWNKV